MLHATASFSTAPPDIATCMYYTGIDPFTGKDVHIARHLRDRKLQRALLPFFKPENYFEVRQALRAAGRTDLIGPGCDCLIPSQPPEAALSARMAKAQRDVTEGRYVHTPKPIDKPNQSSTTSATPPVRQTQAAGYRPHRKSTRRRPK